MRDEASRAQVLAARPGVSTWLSANAGSGKTRVLIDRVARLLLAGTPPQRILCLTYTNAAASEMQNRLFQRLGDWAMKPEAELTAALADLGVEAPDLAEARRLFARAIETPGGLRIQTIHAFCASLLRRFPLEARVAPQFTEVDEQSRALLIREILEEMAEGAEALAIRGLARLFGEHGFFDAVERIAGLRRQLRPAPVEEIRRALGLLPRESVETLGAEVLAGVDPDWWAALIARLEAGGATDQKVARKLAALTLDRPGACLPGLEDALLGKSGARENLPSDREPTQGFRKANRALFEPLGELAERVSNARLRRVALQLAEDAAALSGFAGAFLPRFAEAKRRRGWLDFDDLIERAEALLTDPAVAAWVLFRLDGGIDHILVDEAQDTSPEQWQVIARLTEEFTAGQGARPGGRTLFVVGDKKQSIYSFQGADVSGFEARAKGFMTAFTDAGLGFEARELRHSFRSAPEILALVDRVFGDRYPAALGREVRHVPVHAGLPGRVELWPVEEREAEEDAEDDWTAPVDRTSPRAPRVVLAERLAGRIAEMLAAGTPVPDAKGGVRPARPGDFLILVQRRSGIFPHLLRALKSAGLPVAGADRLKLSEELAVQDLLALLSFLATPEDDLSLATVLRSPLCGWSEAQLYALAVGRPGFLWEAMRAAGDSPARAMLMDLRDQVDFLRPHDLLDRVLTRHRGRVRLIARLGEEVEEAIDALLAQALAYEQAEVPSLDGFLAWIQGDDATIKRQLGAAVDRIRIMTVHGAKGLEGEIVILPDTDDRGGRNERAILVDGQGMAFPGANKDTAVPPVSSLMEARRQREEEEALRLLYVALTRAKSQLIVASAGKASERSWHGLVLAAMQELGAAPDALGRWVLQSPLWPGDLGGMRGAAVEAVSARAEPVPAWMETSVAEPEGRGRPLSPSGLGGAKTLPGAEEDATAKARGTALHLLLQHLPGQAEGRWAMLARSLIAEPGLCEPALERAAALIRDPALAEIFAPGTLAEVPVAGMLEQAAAEGVIDRLIVGPDRVLAVDFKSNRLVPASPAEVPEAILRQMGAYRALLQPAWPGRRIETAVLWTETGALMILPDEIVRAALTRATGDGGQPLDDGSDGA